MSLLTGQSWGDGLEWKMDDLGEEMDDFRWIILDSSQELHYACTIPEKKP